MPCTCPCLSSLAQTRCRGSHCRSLMIQCKPLMRVVNRRREEVMIRGEAASGEDIEGTTQKSYFTPYPRHVGETAIALHVALIHISLLISQMNPIAPATPPTTQIDIHPSVGMTVPFHHARFYSQDPMLRDPVILRVCNLVAGSC
jgi:hypothetical protein